MTKFSSDRFPPGFFDLPQSAGETLPLELIGEWTRSAQTRDIARAILAPHTLRGIVVASDSAGLTRLTRERPLMEILAMLSAPKELVYGHGRAIGGRSIGVWSADNTTMFYESGIDAERVVAMLRTTMGRIAAECELGIGMAAHVGEFYELGGGAHGPDADRVETVAEDHTQGGELVITDDLWNALAVQSAFTVSERADLLETFGRILRVTDGRTLDGLDVSDIAYPAPYSAGFTEGLTHYARTRRDSMAPEQAYQDLAVVLIAREQEEPDVPEVAVLNDLALTAATKRIGATLLRGAEGAEVKCAGLVSIYTFAECNDAIKFARSFRQELADQQVKCRIGIDAGPVLVFDLGPGRREIAGSPVNVASKLAEDVGEFGKIQMTDNVSKRAGAKRERATLQFNVSGVALRAYDV